MWRGGSGVTACSVGAVGIGSVKSGLGASNAAGDGERVICSNAGGARESWFVSFTIDGVDVPDAALEWRLLIDAERLPARRRGSPGIELAKMRDDWESPRPPNMTESSSSKSESISSASPMRKASTASCPKGVSEDSEDPGARARRFDQDLNGLCSVALEGHEPRAVSLTDEAGVSAVAGTSESAESPACPLPLSPDSEAR